MILSFSWCEAMLCDDQLSNLRLQSLAPDIKQSTFMTIVDVFE